jgi:hypothetical protein
LLKVALNTINKSMDNSSLKVICAGSHECPLYTGLTIWSYFDNLRIIFRKNLVSTLVCQVRIIYDPALTMFTRLSVILAKKKLSDMQLYSYYPV